MGSGKSAVGAALARLLCAPFLDSDAEIEKAANMTIAEVFERDGEPFFREKESQVIARLLATQKCVLSTGGGAFLAQVNRDLIAAEGIAVWLRADHDLLWSRVRHKTTRPLLRTANPRQTLEDLCAVREPQYSKARVIVDAEPGLEIEQMAHKVLQAVIKDGTAIEEVR